MVQAIVVSPTCETDLECDPNTRITDGWARNLGSEITTILLDGSRANGTELAKALNADQTVTLIVFYGHGLPDRLLSHQCENLKAEAVIAKNGTSVVPKELAGRNLYSFACLAGRKLGRALKGVNCGFIGYTEEVFTLDEFDAQFESIVNAAASQWARGTPKEQVLKDLKTAWMNMAKDYRYGGPGFEVDRSVLAAACALHLHDCVCSN